MAVSVLLLFAEILTFWYYVLLHHIGKFVPEVRMKRGTLSQPSYVPVHDVAKNLSEDVLVNFPAYHALSGCDSTSLFKFHTKNSTWRTFLLDAKLLNDIGTLPLKENALDSAENFVVRIYNSKLPKHQQSDCTTVDELRAHALLLLKDVIRLSPTSANLHYHIMR